MASEAVPGADARPPGGRKSGFKNPVTWIIVLAVGIGAGAYILYRRSKNAAAATTATTTTPDTTDYSGEIATLQTEIMNLQGSPDSDTSTTTTPAGGTAAAAPSSAPVGLSSTPHGSYADFGWGKVTGATTYELQVVGSGGKGTGTSNVDKTGSDNHAERVALAPGHYKWRVRAINSAGDGPWTGYSSLLMAGGSTSAAPSNATAAHTFTPTKTAAAPVKPAGKASTPKKPAGKTSAPKAA